MSAAAANRYRSRLASEGRCVRCREFCDRPPAKLCSWCVKATRLATRELMGYQRSYRCGTCGESGHTSRSCSQVAPAAPRKYRCGVCGAEGHNSRTCTEPAP